MIIKAFALAGAVGLFSVAAANAQTPQSAAPAAPAKAWPADPVPVAAAKEATAASAAAGNSAVIDGRARVPVNTDVAVTVGIPVELITNGPVPDTAENRAKYGGPDSNAGNHTKPAGN